MLLLPSKGYFWQKGIKRLGKIPCVTKLFPCLVAEEGKRKNGFTKTESYRHTMPYSFNVYEALLVGLI